MANPMYPTIYPYSNSYQQISTIPNYSRPYQTTPYPPVSGALPQYYQAPQPQQTQTDIKWVQGKAGAKAYAMEPGKSIILMDSESNHFYIKSTDPSGMPLPLRTFAYTEEAETVTEDAGKSGSPDMSRFVTKEDIGKILEEYLGPMKKEK